MARACARIHWHFILEAAVRGHEPVIFKGITALPSGDHAAVSQKHSQALKHGGKRGRP